jgi:2-phosphosulfolactate phosphatase
MDRAAHFGWGSHAVERMRGRVGALVVVDVLAVSARSVEHALGLVQAGGPIPAMIGGFRNARSIAEAAVRAAGERDVGVIGAGEHWPDGEWRFALEDILGAGAILHSLGLAVEKEARRARDAYLGSGSYFADFVRGSISGRQLIAEGREAEIEEAVRREAAPSRLAPS